MFEERVEFRSKLGEFVKYGRKFDKAVDTVLAGGVKESRFRPSGRKIFSVVGRMGDEFIDPEKPYCSCSKFFFRVVSGREELCYHLLSYRIAAKTGRIDVIDFTDEEYPAYLAATVRDVLEVIGKSS